MHTKAGMLEFHRRTHQSLSGVIAHCQGISLELLRRELPGFGYPTILSQLHHVVGAEQYWIGVLQGQLLVEELEDDSKDVDSISRFRDRVTAITREWLSSTTEEQLNAPIEVETWGGKRPSVIPALVVIRTQTHIFQHMGQIAAMARLLGHPVPPGHDFPLLA